MTSPIAALEHLRSLVLALYPALGWLRRGSTGGLAVRPSADAIHLCGDAGDPAVARTGDTCGRLYRDTVSGIVYYAPSMTAAYAPIASGLGPPLPVTPGTSIVIATGSTRVTCR